MKKILWGVLVLVVLIGGGLFYLNRNLDPLVAGMIERHGSEALGTEVSVGGVAISLREGRARITDFRVRNPEGFSDQAMMRFDELDVVIDVASLRGDMPRIESVSASNPFVLYELVGERSNLQVVQERLGGAEAPPEDPAAEPLRLAVDALDIKGIQGQVQAERLPRPLSVNLGDVQLRDMQGSPEEIARQVARPLLAQLARNASEALLRSTGELLQEGLEGRAAEAAERVRDQARERLQQLEGEAGEAIGNSLGDEARRGVENFLRRNRGGEE